MVYRCLGFLPFPILLSFLYCHLAAKFVLPAVRPILAGNGGFHRLDVNNASSNDLSNTPRVEQVVENLIRWVLAQEYSHPTLRLVILKVDDNHGGFFNPTMSDNIQSFRKIGCVFHIDVPTPDETEAMTFQNRWPQRWDQWDLNPGWEHDDMNLNQFGAFNFDQVARRLSVEWADRVLKAHGYRGRYGEVVLVRFEDRDLGWCFGFLELPDGERGARLVTIATGEVLDYWHYTLPA